MVDRPIGWYRDPEDPRRHRYWDGERWLSEDEARDRQPRRADPGKLTTCEIPTQRRPPR